MQLTVIETPSQLDDFKNTLHNKRVFLVPVLSDRNQHPVLNTLSAVFVYIDGESYVIAPNHNEVQALEVLSTLFVGATQVCILNKKAWLQCGYPPANLIDLHSTYYYKHGNADISIDTPTQIQLIYRQHAQQDNINRIVPIYLLSEWANQWHDVYVEMFVPELVETFINHIDIPTYAHIEQNGLKVDDAIFSQFFEDKGTTYNMKDGFVYSQYHPYHVTGRPSNSFGGINFAALNKSDGSRAALVSRFENDGLLVLFDFESFHLRLIAELIGYPQPTIPFHEYLGRQYYQKDELTQEEYDEGKQKTFKFLYGLTSTDIDFFKCTSDWCDIHFPNNEATKMIRTPVRKRPILFDSPVNTPILFNYTLQALESETVLPLLHDLMELYASYNSKLILYLYDGILIDYTTRDGAELLQKTKEILECGGKFPVRMYYGSNFNEMRLLNA